MTKARDLSKLLSTANGKIAGANLDVSFENISDSGTAGTKVASGTTGQRGSTAGQIRFNTTTGLAEYYTGTDFKIIDSPPTVTAISPSTALSANTSITITGNNFFSGATVQFIGNDGTVYNSPTVTVNNSGSITALTPATALTVANEPYDVRVTNISGLSSILSDCLDAGSSPAWSTASGNLTTVLEGFAVNTSVSATDADAGQTISYSVASGNLPTGVSLNSSTGAITGTAGSVSGDTTSTFTISATDGTNSASRSFNIITLENGNPWGFWKNENITNGGNWNDSSGNNRTLVRVGSSISYNATDSNFNNLKSLSHTSQSQGNYYWVNETPTTYNNNFSFFAVCRKTGSGSYADALLTFNKTGTDVNNSISYDVNGYHGWGQDSNGDSFTHGKAIVFLRKTGSTVTCNYLTSGTSYTTRFTFTGHYTNASISWNRFSIFNFIHSGHAGHSYVGDIAECIYFKDNSISDGLRDTYTNYLKSKFNI
jgi:hypothetical protein